MTLLGQTVCRLGREWFVLSLDTRWFVLFLPSVPSHSSLSSVPSFDTMLFCLRFFCLMYNLSDLSFGRREPRNQISSIGVRLPRNRAKRKEIHVVWEQWFENRVIILLKRKDAFCCHWVWFVWIVKWTGTCRTARSLHSVGVHSIPTIYFLPDFLMPCWPVFRGPFLPLAASCISFLALASKSVERSARRRTTNILQGTHTGLQLLAVGNVIVIQFLLVLLCGLEGLDLAT